MTAAKELSPSPAFPVVFFDGSREMDIGTVVVDPALGFKKFQFLVSEKIGISPHQISLSLVRRKKARTSPEIRRKLPIDEGSDFSAVARERDCFILAVLRRSRRERRGKSRRNQIDSGGGGLDGDRLLPPEKVMQLQQKTILRRPAEFYGRTQGEAVAAAAEGMGLGFWGYEGLRNLQMRRERYLISAVAAAAVAYCPSAAKAVDEAYVRDAAEYGGGVVVCEVCSAAKGWRAPFHWCVLDRVTEGFRTDLGPIQRPSKAQIQSPA